MSKKPNPRKNIAKQPVPISKVSGLTYGKTKSPTFKSAKAKLAGMVDTGAIEKRLLKQSPWYASISDPLQGAGAKIPDVVGTPTATSQMIQYVTVPVNVNGVAGLKVTCPYMMRSDSLQVGNPTNYYVTIPSSTASLLAWGDGITANTSLLFAGNSALTGSTTTQSVAMANRVVSAAVYADYEGTDLQDSGDLTAWYQPYRLNTVQSVSGTSPSAAQNLYGTSIIPTNRGLPVKVLWFPLSEGDVTYGSFLASDASVVANFPANLAQTQSWEMGIVAQGVVASTGAVKFTIVVNYEWIPRNAFTSLVAPAPSPVDPMEEQITIRGIESLDTTGVSTTKRADAQPGTQRTSPAEGREQAGFGGLGMMFDVVKEILPLAGLLL